MATSQISLAYSKRQLEGLGFDIVKLIDSDVSAEGLIADLEHVLLDQPEYATKADAALAVMVAASWLSGYANGLLEYPSLVKATRAIQRASARLAGDKLSPQVQEYYLSVVPL